MADGHGSGSGGDTGEFHRIAAYFRPLAKDAPAALNLSDDTALIETPPGAVLATTVDTLVEGVHFVGDEPAGLIARKALRVNLSDLAAMGAAPMGYLLSLSVPARIDDAWIAAFAAGLAEDQAAFGLSLLGGDSTSTPGPVSIAVTAMGTVAPEDALRRSGARAGDAVYVSGTIGDGALGLRAAQGRLPPGEGAAALLARYRLPTPRLALGRALAGRATAAMDVSDGLIADLGHICAASGVAARIDTVRVPLSEAAAWHVADDPDLFPELLTGGDDYELLITGAPDRIEAAAREAETPVTRIGEIITGEGVTAVDGDGAPIAFARTGFRHA
jgi:thiamine-monophosphate kinase